MLASEWQVIAAWRDLERTATLPTQSYAFATALIGTMLAGGCIETFSHVADQGVVGLLMLCRDPGYLCRWHMLGSREVFEPNDVVCSDHEAAQGIADAVALQPRPLSLDRIPAGSPLVPALRKAMSGRGFVSVRPAVGYPMIELGEQWRHPEQCFNSGRRSDFRRAERRAEAFGDVTYEILSPTPAQFDALFDEAIAVEMSGWKSEAGTALGSDRKKEEFFRTFFRAACDEGQFRAAFMRIDGKAVAMQMALDFGGKYWLFKIGYDEAYGKCSPGTLLMLHTIRDAAERGLAAYEFLGNCEAWIADFWTREKHECVRVRTYPYNLRGLAAFAADLKPWLRQRLTAAVG